MEPRRFPILFDPWYRALSAAVGIPPARSWIEVDAQGVQVRMAWAFRARFPRSAVASALRVERRVVSRGVHGFAGRWLVNGSGRGIVEAQLQPPQRAFVLGFPVRLERLLVSVADPGALIAALEAQGS